ncbi:MAG: cytochrome C [Melioribacteraceae bacterium]|nr:cytochrome C [Melioribacteraceae bacterium]MCF8354132.1 cytochrome C [Melioribacteraceae bacterium]MCF8393359.1 cytochrome C [Melioribacteraceae bacterium]MCF8418924.1 cytochrome C [Melioribacteraceae bacterium]
MKSIYVVILLFLFALVVTGQDCIECHYEVTPKVVSDWQISKHSENDIDCSVCHGSEHTTMEDYAKAKLPTYETCDMCHSTQSEQYQKGKHALAWAAMNAMPTTHMQPMGLIEGQKGCGGCHKIGIKSEDEIQKMKAGGSTFGHASCDACHTRHTFSIEEARQPQACQTCHQGFDHAQWEMYSTSKHGVRYLLKQNGTLPENTAAPTCQTCHMPEGNHEVRTAWGFLAVKLPLPEDEQWASDQATILKALGALDPQGNPTELVETIKAADVARLTAEDWQRERDKMIGICGDCHSENFVKEELLKADNMIREADRLMAEAINVVAGLYTDGILEKPESYPYNYPMLLTFHDAPTVIEQDLFVMFLKHRMRTFQGAFHANPDYSLWYGWNEMVRDLTKIKEAAESMRMAKR